MNPRGNAKVAFPECIGKLRHTYSGWKCVRCPMPRQKTPERTVYLFWRRVKKTPTCWIWMAGVNTDGYGLTIKYGGTRYTHRIAWLLAGNSLPKWPTQLDHTCHNRLCVRVDHLRVVSAQQNMRNKVAYYPKLPARSRDVVASRALAGESIESLAHDYGVCTGTIYRAIREQKNFA